MTLGLLMDSGSLQFRSLRAFANALGYTQNYHPVWGDSGFYSSDNYNRHRSNVSFNTMVKWYNDAGSMPDFPLYRFIQAQAVKIFTKVKLQWKKKQGRLIVQSHVVEFMHPEYYEEFANYLVKPI